MDIGSRPGEIETPTLTKVPSGHLTVRELTAHSRRTCSRRTHGALAHGALAHLLTHDALTQDALTHRTHGPLTQRTDAQHSRTALEKKRAPHSPHSPSRK
jgi:hypothetical protein